MISELTFTKLISSGAIIDCVGATSGGHDWTSVLEIHFPEDKKTILFAYWIGDKDCRYVHSLVAGSNPISTDILNGQVSLDNDSILLLTPEMENETELFDRINYMAENKINTPTANWNFESLEKAKIEAVKYLKEKFK